MMQSHSDRLFVPSRLLQVNSPSVTLYTNNRTYPNQIAMTQGINPFEDSFNENSRKNDAPTSTNPFDDDIMMNSDGGGRLPSSRTGTNPFGPNPTFDDDDNDDDDEDDTFEITDDENIGAPVEASWQYLGDLPYRRVPVYSNVRWGGSKDESGSGSETLNYGLSEFPKAALQRHPDLLDPRELHELLNTSTVTKVVGCQYGGPVAAVTLPIVGETSWFTHTEIRILTNSGHPLAKIDFPLPELERKYSASDIMEIGFTDRTVLVIVLKDSLCLTYDLSGAALLPPFFILPRGEGQGTDLFQACIFEGGAVSVKLLRLPETFRTGEKFDCFAS